MIRPLFCPCQRSRLPRRQALWKACVACADPKQSCRFQTSRAKYGFENRIAAILAEDLHAELEYTWWAQRRGFVRNTIKAGPCDVVMGVLASFEMLQTTHPYYRSTYVFVTRTADAPRYHLARRPPAEEPAHRRG